MKGYFSRLIQQTGITFGPSGDFRPGFLELSPIRSKGRDEITPIHVEERKLIEPQPDQVIEGVPEGIREDSESSVPIPEDENIRNSIEERFERQISEEPQSRTSEWVKLKGQKREISAGELLEREEMVESDPVGKESVPHLDKPSSSASQEVEDDLVFKPGVESEDRVSQVQIQQAYLKEVREWVAETPIVDNEEIKNRDISKTVEMGERIPVTRGERELPAASYSHPKLMESQQSKEPEIHDFHLSIGTISLTIEEPQKEAQSQSKEPPQVITKERKSNVASEHSRLSRYYIR
ncbi:MAG: hypothetical protein ACE5JP_00115 [Candidatus Bipolaricaulia bacterium]